jgi:putative transposase
VWTGGGPPRAQRVFEFAAGLFGGLVVLDPFEEIMGEAFGAGALGALAAAVDQGHQGADVPGAAGEEVVGEIVGEHAGTRVGQDDALFQGEEKLSPVAAALVGGKRVITTLPGGQAERAPDLLDRDFVAAAPNRCWVADFTHVMTWAGVVYVAFVVDTFCRRIVGWSAATVKETVFVLDALEMAVWQRDRDQHPVQPGELIHHSDAGSQYTSFRLAEHLDAAGIAASIGSVGDAYDNALMESTIGLYKTELIKPQRPWKSLSQVELATAEWLDWYNHRRLHGEIGHVPPVEYEANHYMESTKPQVTTVI